MAVALAALQRPPISVMHSCTARYHAGSENESAGERRRMQEKPQGRTEGASSGARQHTSAPPPASLSISLPLPPSLYHVPRERRRALEEAGCCTSSHANPARAVCRFLASVHCASLARQLSLSLSLSLSRARARALRNESRNPHVIHWLQPVVASSSSCSSSCSSSSSSSCSCSCSQRHRHKGGRQAQS